LLALVVGTKLLQKNQMELMTFAMYAFGRLLADIKKTHTKPKEKIINIV
jgi:hypothetical protein